MSAKPKVTGEEKQITVSNLPDFFLFNKHLGRSGNSSEEEVAVRDFLPALSEEMCCTFSDHIRDNRGKLVFSFLIRIY